MKPLTSAQIQELESTTIYTANLIHIVFSNSNNEKEDVFVTDFHRNIIDDNDYTALGHFLNLTSVTQTDDLQINDITLTLSGIDQQFISYVLNYRYIDREIIIKRALIDNNDNLIGETIVVFSGRINQPTISENEDEGTLTVNINASSFFADFERASARHTNHVEHNYYYPTDNFFKQWGKIDEEIIWGER